MKNNPSPPPPASVVAEILALTGKVPHLHDYFAGMVTPETARPESILCFIRRSGAALVGNRIRGHHHRFVLIMALEGSGRICIDADHLLLQPGEAVLIFPFQFHSYMEMAEDICWVFFTFEATGIEALEPLRSSPSHPMGSTEMILQKEMLQCWVEPGRRPLVAPHLGLLLARLAATARKRSGRQAMPAAAKSSDSAELLGRVNRYILPRLAEPLGLAEIAREMGQSESHLRARFRAATGTSLGRHLRDLRLQKACSLLHTTGLPITEIAERCGFDSVYAFSRAFKQARGASPRDYRQRHGLPTKAE